MRRDSGENAPNFCNEPSRPNVMAYCYIEHTPSRHCLVFGRLRIHAFCGSLAHDDWWMSDEQHAWPHDVHPPLECSAYGQWSKGDALVDDLCEDAKP